MSSKIDKNKKICRICFEKFSITEKSLKKTCDDICKAKLKIKVRKAYYEKTGK